MSGLLIIIVSAWFLGGLGVLVLGLKPLESLILRIHLGLAACAVIILVSASYSLSAVTYALGLCMVLSAAAGSRLKAQATAISEPVDEPNDFELLDYLCLGGTGLICALMFLAALAPVTSWDAGVAHLALPSDYVRHGRIHLLSGNVYSVYPQALHCLYTYLFFMSGERGVMVFCWILGVLACATLYVFAKELGGRRAGIIAVSFLVSAPIFISQAGTVAIDLPFVGVILSVLLCLVIWQRNGGAKWLITAGILAGFACGIRHTGYVATVLCAVGIFMQSRNPKYLLTFVAVAVLAASPWFMRSYLLVGNPVFPLLESVFEQDVFARHQVTEFGEHETIKETSVLGFLTYSWDLVMHPDRYDGWGPNPGGWIWILGIPGLIMGGRKARWIGLFCLAGISSFYMVQRLARYAVAFFVPMMAVAGVAGSRLSHRCRVMSVAIVFALLYGCALTAGSMYFKIPVALGMESREEYLLKRLDQYEAFEWVNMHVPRDGIVLTLDMRSYYIDRETFQNTSELYVLKEMDFDAKAAWFSKRGIRYLLMPEDVIQHTPVHQAMGLIEEFETWKDAPKHFRVFAQLEFQRARGDGFERVTVYEVVSPEFGNE